MENKIYESLTVNPSFLHQVVENRTRCEELCDHHQLAFMFFSSVQRAEDPTNCYCLISDDVASQQRDLSFSVYPSDIANSLCTEGREISRTGGRIYFFIKHFKKLTK